MLLRKRSGKKRRYSMIYVTGDTHGPRPFGPHSIDGYSSRLNTDSFPEQKEMNRNDYVIICGDFGGIWNYDSRYDETMSAFKEKVALDRGESKEEKYWLDWLGKKSFTVLFCDGNHENFDRLGKAYPEVEFHGGRAHRIRENVYHLMRGYVFDIDGCSIFVFGGALSHDISDGIFRTYEYASEDAFKKDLKRAYDANLMTRVEHISWWKEELPSQEEMDRGISELEKHGNKVDFIVSHCAPQSITCMFGITERDILTMYFNKIAETVAFKKWFFGHYHDNKQIMTKWIMLYEQIVRIN